MPTNNRKVVYRDDLGDTHIYMIPDIWIAGFCTGARARGEPSEVMNAVQAWHVQAQLAKRAEAEKEVS